MNVHIKHNDIRNIVLNTGKDISENDYEAISTIDKNLECGYYLVQLTSDSYTFQSSYKIGKILIRLASWCVMQYI